MLVPPRAPSVVAVVVVVVVDADAPALRRGEEDEEEGRGEEEVRERGARLAGLVEHCHFVGADDRSIEQASEQSEHRQSEENKKVPCVE